MKFKKEYPPNIDAIIEHFPHVKDNKGVVFTYGDTLYGPHCDEKAIELHLWAHEAIHMQQQGDDPEAWWQRYFDDRAFRLNQEAEAYQAQYEFIKHRYGGATAQNVLTKLAKDLSSPIYEAGITYQQAEKIIKAKSSTCDV